MSSTIVGEAAALTLILDRLEEQGSKIDLVLEKLRMLTSDEQAALDNLTGKLGTLSQSVTTVATANAGLTTQLGTANTLIAQLQQQLAAQGTSLTADQAQIAQDTADAAQQSSDVTNALNTASQTVDLINASITTLGGATIPPVTPPVTPPPAPTPPAA